MLRVQHGAVTRFFRLIPGDDRQFAILGSYIGDPPKGYRSRRKTAEDGGSQEILIALPVTRLAQPPISSVAQLHKLL